MSSGADINRGKDRRVLVIQEALLEASAQLQRLKVWEFGRDLGTRHPDCVQSNPIQGLRACGEGRRRSWNRATYCLLCRGV
jgi:hypothetical protein